MISSMKQKMTHEEESHIADTSKMIKENTILIHEINSVRKEMSIKENRKAKSQAFKQKKEPLPLLNPQ